MKQLTISNCRGCPYFEGIMPEMFTEGGAYCTYKDKYKQICTYKEYCKEKPIHIPSWCAL